MLTTVRALLNPSGTLVFEEAIHLTRPTSVLVTLLEEVPGQAVGDVASASAPWTWALSDAERQIWEALPAFRSRNPLRIDSFGQEP